MDVYYDGNIFLPLFECYFQVKIYLKFNPFLSHISIKVYQRLVKITMMREGKNEKKPSHHDALLSSNNITICERNKGKTTLDF